MAKLLYQGHGSLRVVTDEGIVIYIDPYAGDGYDIPADLILVTHQHYDHNMIEKPVHAADCIVYQNMEAHHDGIYEKIVLNGVEVEAVEAYNKNHKKEECVGYLLTINDYLLYFAGDTSETEQMKELAGRKIDYAFLPTDGIYNMGMKEAMHCAELIGAKHTIPIHMAPGRLFSKHRAKKFKVEGGMILEPGQEIEL